MFTGIVEERGEVVEVTDLPDSARITVAGPLVTSDAKLGDSIAVNGVCLTVVHLAGTAFTVDVVRETLDRTSLAKLAKGDPVNLERAMALGDRLGGHIVQGHVDGTGVVVGGGAEDARGLTWFAMPDRLARYLSEKGSITVDGVSLTVAAVADDKFAVALIPATLEMTTLGLRQPGDLVNLEVDVLAKYVEKLVAR